MSETPDEAREREIGVEFGSLAEHLASHEYPTTSAELVETYGDAVLMLQSGEQTLREVFDAMAPVSFDSAEEARQAILSSVDERAIGRKGYSDRTPPSPGEETEYEPESL
jgi:hypothetical protein